MGRAARPVESGTRCSVKPPRGPLDLPEGPLSEERWSGGCFGGHAVDKRTSSVTSRHCCFMELQPVWPKQHDQERHHLAHAHFGEKQANLKSANRGRELLMFLEKTNWVELPQVQHRMCSVRCVVGVLTVACERSH